LDGIRHIATSIGSDGHFLTAAFERDVQLWSFEEQSLLASLETVLDFGGRRLALCARGDDPVVVAGAWERHGICAYSREGEPLWQRKDLRRVQYMAPAADGEHVVACFDEGPMHVLAVESGETVATVRGIRGFSASRFADVGAGFLDGHVALVDSSAWSLQWKAPIAGFSILAAALAPGAVAVADVSEGGGGTLASFNLAGDSLWRCELPEEMNCPTLAWDDDADEWVGVLRHVNNERPDTLVRWSPDGTSVGEHPLGLFEELEFLPSGRHLVTSEGEVRETGRGEVVWQLPET
jgi:hypothetical protein